MFENDLMGTQNILNDDKITANDFIATHSQSIQSQKKPRSPSKLFQPIFPPLKF